MIILPDGPTRASSASKPLSTRTTTTKSPLWRPGLYLFQSQALSKLAPLHYGYAALEMGLGKSIVAISLFEHWATLGLRRFIFVCPNSLTETICIEAVKWGSTLKFKRFESSARTHRINTVRSPDWDVLVVNYEALRTLYPEIIRQEPGGIVADEAQALKNRTAMQTRAARAVFKAVKENHGPRLLMTGTPIAKNILDLWSQVDVLSPGPPAEHPLGLGNYNAFERSVAFITRHPRLPQIKFYNFRPEVVKEVTERMAAFSVFKRSADVLDDLPKQTWVTVPLTMGETQKKIYNALRREMLAELSGTDVEPAVREVLKHYDIPTFDPGAFTVSTAFAPVLTMRLAQITSGFVHIDSGANVPLPGNVKLEWLRENLPALTDRDDNNKTVIFARFIYDVDAICKLCDELKIGHVRIDGSTSKNAGSAVEEFQRDPNIRVVVANVQVGGQGFTMTAANTEVFYSNSYRNILRQQALKRIHRISQERPVTYYDLACQRTVDYDILDSLKADHDLAYATLDELKSALINRGDA